MIIRVDSFQEACKNILATVDSNSLSMVTETLQLKTVDNTLYLSVTNREYYAEVKFELKAAEEFHAAVNANLFLRLIAQITTETIDLSIVDNSLVVKGNGTYKLPLIFDGDKMLELPKIEIMNPTVEMKISSENLLSILNYNSKELVKGTVARPVQNMYYVDEKGCITFTTGACVNNFTLEKPVSILLNNRVVKLFKLFKSGDVAFTLGYDAISDDTIQTKVKFETKDITITAALTCDDSLLKSVPVTAIRNRAMGDYPHSVNLNKDALLETINRLLLFTDGKVVAKPYSTLAFKKDHVLIYDTLKDNSEKINYVNTGLNDDEEYEAVLDLVDLKTTVETCPESYIKLNFGNGQAFVLVRGNVYNVIPEVRMA